jgi:hypothetical protein
MFSVISRSYGAKETTGCWYIFDGDRSIFNCKTIELPWKNNQHMVSCIPAGIYDVEKYIRPNGDKCFWVKNVPGRDSILVHKGNFASGVKVDTEGCILPGMRFVDLNHDGNIDVAESTTAMNMLLNLLPDKFKIYII